MEFLYTKKSSSQLDPTPLFPSGVKIIPIKFDKNSYYTLKNYAKSKGMPVSTYIRSVVMNSVPEEFRDLTNPIKREGRFQLTKKQMISIANSMTQSQREEFMNILQKQNIPMFRMIKENEEKEREQIEWDEEEEEEENEY